MTFSSVDFLNRELLGTDGNNGTNGRSKGFVCPFPLVPLFPSVP
jgi:hypothetical protein